MRTFARLLFQPPPPRRLTLFGEHHLDLSIVCSALILVVVLNSAIYALRQAASAALMLPQTRHTSPTPRRKGMPTKMESNLRLCGEPHPIRESPG